MAEARRGADVAASWTSVVRLSSSSPRLRGMSFSRRVWGQGHRVAVAGTSHAHTRSLLNLWTLPGSGCPLWGLLEDPDRAVLAGQCSDEGGCAVG